MISSDQRASLLGIIEEEKRTVKHYDTLLVSHPDHAQAARWKALKRWHQKEITKRRKEMRSI